MTVLELSGITKAYGAFRLGPVDLTVGGETLAVLGPSGCGKTTLLSVVAGVTSPDAGSVTLDGRRLDGHPPERRGTVLVFQEGALFPHMTARENIEYAATGTDVEDLAATLEIGSVLDRRAATLSGGEGQRVALARALAADPDALLLDEPLANLDAPIKRRLRDDLRDLLAPLSIPVVYVTHDQTEASSIGDRVAVMNDGRFAQIGTPADVFDRPATPFVASFTGAANVFRATVEDGRRLRWGSHRLDAPVEEYADGDVVWFCVRPERIGIADDPSDEAGNVVEGRVAGRVFEGGAYRIGIRPDGVDAILDVRVFPPAYDRHRLGDRERVAVEIPDGTIHPIGSGSPDDPEPATDRANG